MADDILDSMDEELDDSMADILDDSDEDFFDEDFSGDELDEEDLGGDLGEEVDEYVVQPDEPEKKSPVKHLLEKAKSLGKSIFSSKKRIIIVSAAAALFLILIIGLIILLSGGEDETAKEEIQMKNQISKPIPQEPEIIFEDIVDLEPFERIPLKSSSSMRFLSITVSLELIDHRYRKQIYSVEDRINRIITDQAAEMTWLELRNPEGKIMLKYNLLKRINSIFPKATVRNIYFTHFVMQ